MRNGNGFSMLSAPSPAFLALLLAATFIGAAVLGYTGARARLQRAASELVAVACSRSIELCAAAGDALAEVEEQHESAALTVGLLAGLAGAGLSLFALLALQGRQPLATQLRRAIAAGELTLVYEPVIDLESRAVVGAEALVRWRDKQGEQVSPEVFIELAEDLGLITRITAFVVRSVTEQLDDVLRTSDLQVSINIAAADLLDDSLAEELRRNVAERGLSADRIVLELTERSTADRGKIAAGIERVRSLGHSFCVDDFGVGYSSLSYLQELHIDSFKIDKSFVAALTSESVTASVLPQILAIAETLRLKAIIEGVETPEQEAALRALGARFVQGWLYGQPLTAAQLKNRISTGAAGITG